MKITSVVASVTWILLSACGSGSELTRAQAKRVLDKEVSAPPYTDSIVFSSEQIGRVQAIPESQVWGKVFIEHSGRQCLTDRSDMRALLGFAICGKDRLSLDIGQTGTMVQLKAPIPTVIVEITGVSDDATPSQKLVNFTWQYDLSSFPKELRDAIRQPLFKGAALLRLYDDGWRFEKFQ